MAAARTSIVVTLLAVVLLVASVQASGGRTLLTNFDSAGLRDCGASASAAQMATKCPADGQRYQLCLTGSAKGGCTLEYAGLFPPESCTSFCGTTNRKSSG